MPTFYKLYVDDTLSIMPDAGSSCLQRFLTPALQRSEIKITKFQKINTEVHPVFTSRKIKDELIKLRNLNLQLSASKTLYISLNVICVMQIISGLQADTYISVWRSTNDR